MKKIIGLLVICLLINACKDDDTKESISLDETPYIIDTGNFPTPDLPQDNALTVAGVELGRMLFYEKKLSKNNTQACANCHKQQDAFNDLRRFSRGVEGLDGTRNAMSIFNMAWHNNGFFWDGRENMLRDQALEPIQDPLEMNETIENVITKLSNESIYADQFIRAFGDDEITAERMGLAMEQFMLSIVSHDSKYDQYLAGEVELTESEERGRQLYFTEYNPFFPDESGADCEHCHGGFNFTNNQYMNNGLDEWDMMTDLGRALATGNENDKGKFKVPSLRNIAITPPYMHDGRFQTLEETVRHYNEHIKNAPSLDPALLQVVENNGLQLSDEDINDIVNFLHILTDESLLTNEAYFNPF